MITCLSTVQMTHGTNIGSIETHLDGMRGDSLMI